MAVEENQIGETRLDRSQYGSHDLRHFLASRRILGSYMAAVNHRCWTMRMQPDPVPKIFRPLPNVIHQQVIEIAAAGTEQTNQISGSVLAFVSTVSDTSARFHPVGRGCHIRGLLQVNQ